MENEVHLTYLDVKNWCQFKHARIEFSTGLTGVYGPNGVGKSHLMDAILYGLCGFTHRNKSRNLRFGSADGYVELGFMHGGQSCVVHRDISSSRCWLQVGDNSRARSASEVNQQMAEIVGMSAQLLHRQVIVPQTALTAIISARPAERKDEFVRLCGLSRFGELDTLLLQQLSRYPHISFDSSPEQLTAQLAELDAALSARSAELAALERAMASTDMEAHERVLASWEARRQRQATLVAVEQQLQDVSASLSAAKSHLAALQQRDKSSLLESLRPEYEKAVAQLQSHAQAQRMAEYRRSCQAELANFEGQLAQLRASAPPADDASAAAVATLREQYHAARSRMDVCQRFITTFDGNANPECPTCHRPMENAADTVASYRAELSRLQAETARLASELRAAEERVSAHTARVSRWQSQVESLTASVESARTRLAALSDKDDVVTVDIEMAQSLVSRYNQLVAANKDIVTQLNLLNVQVARLDESHRSLLERQVELSSVDGTTITEEMFKAAQAAKVLHQQRLQTVGELRGVILAQQNRRCDLELQRQELTERFEQQRRVQELRGRLECIRALYHRDNAPRLLMQRGLQVVTAAFQRVLERMGLPYAVTLDDELAFQLRNGDGHTLAADELSGGEGMLFSVAFRLAIHEQFAASLGVLVLDEPTAWVDDDNVAVAADVLSSLRTAVSQAGLQLLVVTHAQELLRAMDTVVDVAALRGEVD